MKYQIVRATGYGRKDWIVLKRCNVCANWSALDYVCPACEGEGWIQVSGGFRSKEEAVLFTNGVKFNPIRVR